MTSQPAAEAPAAAAAAAEQAPAPRGVVEAPVRPDVAAAAAAAQAYGAAAVSLIDPACKPGTPQFASAKAQMDQLLQKYRDRVAQLAAAGQAKPDMVAYKQVRTLDPSAQHQPTYGHIPGCAVGDAFEGRGELAILGLHVKLMKGIAASVHATHGAYAICLSGGYKDDSDDGHTFWYTGVGGQGSGTQKRMKQQVEDQDYNSLDNKALVLNHTTSTPVRVFRAKTQRDANGRAKNMPLYVYEGLYQVVDHRRVPSQDGPLVCQFRMQGVPGHSAVSAKVEYTSPNISTIGSRAPRRFKRVELAAIGGGGSRPVKLRPTAQPSYSFNFKLPNKSDIQRQIAERKTAGRHGRLVSADISGGLEKVPIPMWNNIDDDDTIGVGASITAADDDQEPEKLTYLADYAYGEATARAQAVRAEQHFRRYFPHSCGIQYHNGCSCYTEEGLLTNTEQCGVMECDTDCKGPEGDASSSCKGNTVLQRGITYPLEVFKAAGKGWGVRCSVDIPVGAVLCAYTGIIITDSTADLLKGMDRYLFDLDHFMDIFTNQQQQQQQQQQLQPGQPTPIQAQGPVLLPLPQQQQQSSGQQQPQAGPAPPPSQQQQQQQEPPPQQPQDHQQPWQPLPQQPSRLGPGSSIRRSVSGAAGSQSGGKRQLQRQDSMAGPRESEGWDANLPPMHPELMEAHLVVDASHEGNVARFINHSCDPNCLVQPVLAKNARSHLLYYSVIVAQEDIPAFTELTYNYYYKDHQQPLGAQPGAAAAAAPVAAADADPSAGMAEAVQQSARIPCMCGATNCCKWLLVS